MSTYQQTPSAAMGISAIRASLITRTDHTSTANRHARVRSLAVGVGYWAGWMAVVSQPSRFDIAWAQLTTARTWPESSAARHRTDHG